MDQQVPKCSSVPALCTTAMYARSVFLVAAVFKPQFLIASEEGTQCCDETQSIGQGPKLASRRLVCPIIKAWP